MAPTSSHQYDLILLGATGFTGKLTAEYITKHLPRDLNWAVAGRSHDKLAGIVKALQEVQPDRKQPAIETTELSKESLNSLVRKTRVLVSTVGPYHRYGGPVIEACANAGTHYVDCCGETPWVYDIAHKYHKLAQSNKAILITQCGIESAPADIVAYIVASFMRENFSVGTADLVHSLQEFNNSASGGTLHSLITVASSYSLSHLRKSLQPLSLCADKLPTTPPTTPRFYKLTGSHSVPGLGLLTDSVLGVPDTNLVYRSWSLIDGGNFYGPKFNYFTGMKAKNRISGFLWHSTMNLSMLMLLLPPVRWLLTSLIPQPGEGPSKVVQEKNSTSWKAIAHSDSNSSQTAVCNMSFAGDMYSLTAILLAEAAMVLLRPDRENWAQKIGGGVLTPATLGDQFIERVKAAGIQTEVELIKR